jgi:hypothetical protein
MSCFFNNMKILQDFWITLPNNFFPRAKINFFHKFSTANYYSVLSFFPARQISEIILNEPSKSTENALIGWLQKVTTKYFLKFKVYVVSLVINLISKTGFGILLAHMVFLKSEKEEMPENYQVHVSRITLILSS